MHWIIEKTYDEDKSIQPNWKTKADQPTNPQQGPIPTLTGTLPTIVRH